MDRLHVQHVSGALARVACESTVGAADVPLDVRADLLQPRVAHKRDSEATVETGATAAAAGRKRLAVKIIAASSGNVARFSACQPSSCTPRPASSDAHACEPKTVKSLSACAR